MNVPQLCPVALFGTVCGLPFGHQGFHKTLGALVYEATLEPDECRELEDERWAIRREMDSA